MHASFRTLALTLNQAVTAAPQRPARLTRSDLRPQRTESPRDDTRADQLRQRRQSRPVGRILRALVGCGVGAILINTWLIAGLAMPLRVVSDSMAPALLGPHREWVCAGCDRAFVCSAETLPAQQARCPWCGESNNNSVGQDFEGQRVFVDRSAFLWRAPRRWEVVVLRNPEQPDVLCVKRIVGLPGECLRIVDGEIVANGQVAGKDLPDERRMAIDVYAPHQRDDCLTLMPAEHWTQSETGALVYSHFAARQQPASAAIDWLTYRHHSHSLGHPTRDFGPLFDDNPFAQSESRALHAVPDLFVRCDVQSAPVGALYLRGGYRDQDYLVQIDLGSGQASLAVNAVPVQTFELGAVPLRNAVRLELMLADGRVELALDGRRLFQQLAGGSDTDTRQNPTTADGAQTSWAIGVRGQALTVSDLRVARDVYYLPGRQGESREYQLGPDEYFALGDNSSSSRDSRHWIGGGAVPANLLVGRVLSWQAR